MTSGVTTKAWCTAGRTRYRRQLVVCGMVGLLALGVYEALLRPVLRRDGGGRVDASAGSKSTSTTAGMLVEAPGVAQSLLADNGRKTVYVVPGKEDRCEYQYDYLCKFWFHVRCYILGGFPSVVVLSSGEAGAAEFRRRARDGDVGLLVWRSKNHSAEPELLGGLLEWRRGAGVARVRLGVFHIANEKRRFYWPWYRLVDFVVRNYWVGGGLMPRHAVYVPLGGQMPEVCVPGSTREGRAAGGGDGARCGCGGLRVKRATERRWLWNFGGSLRKRRGRLLRLAGESETLRGRGLVKVSRRFGGDGVFGAQGGSNPKASYLAGIADSVFVFAPCGNAMETHRVYEAVMLGAIPVVEECEGGGRADFFPLAELRVRDVDGMVRLVERYARDRDGAEVLQRRVMRWWTAYAREMMANVSRVVGAHVAVPRRGTAGTVDMEEWD